MKKLFVGNLPYSTSNQELTDMFAAIGKVLSATVITDKFSGQSKGFGFVEMENDDEAEKAIKDLNGTPMGGRNIIVSEARPREERRPGGDRGGDRGGFHRQGR